jgi:hypothetical protein
MKSSTMAQTVAVEKPAEAAKGCCGRETPRDAVHGRQISAAGKLVYHAG